MVRVVPGYCCLIVLSYLSTLLTCVLGAATPVAGGSWLWLAGRRVTPIPQTSAKGGGSLFELGMECGEAVSRGCRSLTLLEVSTTA